MLDLFIVVVVDGEFVGIVYFGMIVICWMLLIFVVEVYVGDWCDVEFFWGFMWKELNFYINYCFVVGVNYEVIGIGYVG